MAMPLLSPPAGAPDAFAADLALHLDGLYGAALRYTRDPGQAEDLVHDTCVRALRFRDRFVPGSNFRAWIYTILTNTFIHRYRRQKREREILEGSARQDVERELRSEAARDLAQRPEIAYLHNLLSDDVIRALESIPADFRMVVVMCDIEGLSYRDIAAAAKVPVGTVMSRLYRGRRLLESKLEALAVERGIVRRVPAAAAVASGVAPAAAAEPALPPAAVIAAVAGPRPPVARRRK